MNSDKQLQADTEISEGTQSLINMLKYLFICLRIVLICLVVSYFFSGIYINETGQDSLIFQFGKFEEAREGKENSGIKFALPKPIQSVVKIRVQRQNKVNTRSFWTDKLDNEEERKNTQAEENIAYDLEKEGYLLTGDMNIIHTEWSLEYSISDSKKYYLNYSSEKEVNEALKFALENSVLKAVSQTRILDAYRDNPESLRTRVMERVKSLADEMELGVTITSVNYINSEVPISTLKYFESSNAAKLTQAKFIDRATNAIERDKNIRKEEAQEILTQAETRRAEIVSEIEQQVEEFKSYLDGYEKSKTVILQKYLEAVNEFIASAETRQVVNADSEVRIDLPDVKINNESNKQ